MRKWLYIGWVVLLTCSGCRPQTEAGAAFKALQKAIEQKNTKQAWKMLSRQSQNAIKSLLARHKDPTPAHQFFTKGKLLKGWTLRPDPKRKHDIKGKKATLYFRDELEQPIRVTMVYEQKTWKYELPLQHMKPRRHIPKKPGAQKALPTTLPTKAPKKSPPSTSPATR